MHVDREHGHQDRGQIISNQNMLMLVEKIKMRPHNKEWRIRSINGILVLFNVSYQNIVIYFDGV